MALEKFHFTTKSGKKITVPKYMQGITAGFIRRIRKMPEAEQMFEVIEAVVDEKALALIDELDAKELGQFYNAWQQDAGLSAGESSASATS